MLASASGSTKNETDGARALRRRTTNSKPDGHADGFDLRRFQVGQIYDVGPTLGPLLLAEGWAKPVDDLKEPALVVPVSQLTQRTVLVVDDDADLRALLKTVLHQAGFLVVEAANGGDALVALVKHRPALILLDLNMPGVNGQQFRDAQRRLQDPALAQTPIVIVSGVENASDMARRLGAAGFFEKPLDPEEVVVAVRGQVSER